jgi:hypothetical protein
MTIRTTPQILCDIIKNGLSLKDDQIWIYNQRREIPTDKKLYIVVGLMSSVAYGNINLLTTAATESLHQYMKETLTINIFSYTQEAQEKYSMVLGSMMSTYSQQQQELLGLKIFPIPVSINDVSLVEGASLLNRMSITLQVLRKYDMILDKEYYDDFEDIDIHTEISS